MISEVAFSGGQFPSANRYFATIRKGLVISMAIKVLKGAERCSNIAEKVLKRCLKCAQMFLKRCLKCAQMSLKRCWKGAQKVLKRCSKGAEKVLKMC